ncbi:MAG: dockerin type I repeat-containing protein [Candidatus Zixiibacteriota bacterium]
MRKIVIFFGFFCLVWYLTATEAVAQVAGDANGDSVVNGADVVYEINYLFIGGLQPHIFDSGDVNGDEQIDIADVVYLINYLFIGGPSPVEC